MEVLETVRTRHPDLDKVTYDRLINQALNGSPPGVPLPEIMGFYQGNTGDKIELTFRDRQLLAKSRPRLPTASRFSDSRSSFSN